MRFSFEYISFPSRTSAMSLSLACSKIHIPSLSASTTPQFRASQANCRAQRTVRCMSVSYKQETVRRLGNYQPSIWDDEFLQSLTNEFAGECYEKQTEKLKKDVKEMLDDQVVDPVSGLEIIDDLQRLGVSYHFEAEIKTILETIYNNSKDSCSTDDLYTEALKFRLLRQHGFPVSTEIFKKFKDNSGNFTASLCDDIMGLLYFYEASYHSTGNETILDEARLFTTKNLESYLHKQDTSDHSMIAKMIRHALELPLHWRVSRLEARWFIDVYRTRTNMNPGLLQLAILDFNMVQATHLEDLKHVSRWWKNTGLAKKLGFARDRLVENFLWTIGLQFKPQFRQLRRTLTIVNVFITVIDDVYDVYGTMDELQPFTKAVERWDVIMAMEQLPSYMKLCFLGLFNNVNEMGYDTFRGKDHHIIPYLKNAWADLCKSYMVEATWYHNGYTPSFKDYMNNAWISASCPLELTHAYFLSANPITKEAIECLQEYPKIIEFSSTIVRLADDLATSKDEMERGDVPKSIQCYMHEAGVLEEDARAHIKYLIGETWKKMNKERFVDSPFSDTYIDIVMNFARMAQCMYLYGDGHASQDRLSKERVSSLLIDPILFD